MPDINHLTQKILRKEISVEILERHISEHSPSPHSCIELEVGAPLFRARVLLAGDLPSLVRDASYPPLECTVLQRANKLGEQVFYASDSIETTFAECRVREGDYVFVGEWKNIRTLSLNKVGFASETGDLIEKLCHEVFSHPDRELYAYTSSIAQKRMSNDALHGIVYPSVARKGGGLNMALKTTTADLGITFVKARMFRVKRAVGVSVEVEHVGEATSPDGVSLEWV